MGVREHVSRRQTESTHFVQFFDSDDTRHDSVAAFLAEANRTGSSLMVIARPLNSPPILERLEACNVRVRRDVAAGRIVVLDAAETLRRISRAGSPDAERFDDLVGGAVERASLRGCVCAYSEMVDMLAQRGDFDDAVLLEELWNRLLTRTGASLMCGCSAAHFVTNGTQDALRDICAAHSEVRVEAQDSLAAWVLQQAQ